MFSIAFVWNSLFGISFKKYCMSWLSKKTQNIVIRFFTARVCSTFFIPNSWNIFKCWYKRTVWMCKKIVGWGHGWGEWRTNQNTWEFTLSSAPTWLHGLWYVILLGFLACKIGKAMPVIPSLSILKCMKTFLSILNNRFNCHWNDEKEMRKIVNLNETHSVFCDSYLRIGSI